MNSITILTTDEIKEAVNAVKKIKPGYATMLDLYEMIFIAQENAKKDIRINDFEIPKDILAVKLQEQFPLINISQFIIDRSQSEKLFNEICSILATSDNELSQTVRKITGLIENNPLKLDMLFSSFLKEDEALFNNFEIDTGVDKKILAFIIYNSLKPSLNLFAEKMSQLLDKDKEWNKGYCPVCGSAPELSTFEENGKRSLICGFCSHKWESKRIYCPFCENTDHETLQYFDIEGEEEYRVDVCDKCKKYIKTVDINKTSRLIYPPLESQSTPYIDVKFEELGYLPGNSDPE